VNIILCQLKWLGNRFSGETSAKKNLKTVWTSTFLVDNTGYGERVSTKGWEDDRTGSSKIFCPRKIVLHIFLLVTALAKPPYD